MMQLEIEKFSSQLSEGIKLKKILIEINVDKVYETVQLGSLVFTNNANYFISISAGKLNLDGIDYLAISLSSPLGQSLYNRSVNDEFVFRDKVYKIEAIY